MGQAPNSVRVVVADDEPMVRAGFVALLNHADGVAVVGEAANGGEAVHVCLAMHPDVVLMDVQMPVIDGIEATRLLLSDAADNRSSAPRIVMMTRSDADQYVYEAIRQGACAILPKDVGPADLAAAVRSAATDDSLPAAADLLRIIEEFTAPDPDRPDLAAVLDSLDESDVRLIAAVAAGFSDEQIGEHFGVGAGDVASRLSDLRARAGLRDRTRIVLFAVESGLAERFGVVSHGTHRAAPIAGTFARVDASGHAG